MTESAFFLIIENENKSHINFYFYLSMRTIINQEVFVMTTLDKVKRGQKVVICTIPDDRVRAQAIRFGVCEGTEVTCAEKLPAGPVIISKGYQELAIGRGIAQKITVQEAS